jgi:transposase
MEQKLFVGIDISKLTVDVNVLQINRLKEPYYKQFDNTKEGYKLMQKWILTIIKFTKEEALFCMENTGVYSLLFSMNFSKEGYFIWVENPLEIKKSLGMQRGKSDKIDSLKIAEYAYRFRDRAKRYAMPSKTLFALKDLEAYRERLVKIKSMLKVSSEGLFDNNISTKYIQESTTKMIKNFDEAIAAIEKKVTKFIQEEEELKRVYNLAVSVKGIGMQTAVFMLIHTQGFTTFSTSRQFACYCGVAPFEHSSGTSVKGKTRVSHLANKKLKSLLHMCGRSVVQHDLELKAYYERKIAEGKKENCVMNMIKNKLIGRVFSVVKRGEAFMSLEDYKVYKKTA